ncbi:hypothetical protein ILUMI_00339 [Ignelater luminosus]|uniref:Uncharacterized protein n=1 Tax=Ignelater luminosus TaxID=2038154 RepID=A0A8K0GQB6_IGNLU|nr:hypothetical protein ILUMI_00339 [Ignelater luminosus]
MRTPSLMSKVLPNKPKFIKALGSIHILCHFILTVFLLICIFALRINIQNKFKKAYPKLEIQPSIDGPSRIVLIRYDESEANSVDRLIDLIDNFFEAYRTKSDRQNVASICDYEHRPKKGQSCPINFDNFGPCISSFYGYYSYSPCVFLILSEIYDWIPDYYNATNELPPSMPEDLVKEIKLASAKHEDDQIWTSCAGKDDVDKESIEAFNYYPGRGFPSYYFPATRGNNEFLGPIIAVEIVNPKPGYVIIIECRIWSKNLPYVKANFDRQESIRFAIMKDELVY